MELEIITPNEVVSQEADVSEVIIPSQWGQMDILPKHADYMTLLSKGELTYIKGGQTLTKNVGSGLCMVSKEKVTVLVDDVYASVTSLDEARKQKP